LEAQKTANSQGNSEQKKSSAVVYKLYRAIAIKKKKHGTDTKTDMKTNGTEYKTQIWIHAATPTWFLTKVPKTYDKGKTASSTNVAGKTGYLPAENWTRSMSFTLYKYQLKVG
jgi:hypothetical protein